MSETGPRDALQSDRSADSFEEFFRAARDDVARALVLTLGDRDLGVEAADEAMARAFQRWDEIGSYESPQGWVYRVGLNWARSVWRKRRREVADVYAESILDEPPAARDVDVERALASLDVQYRAVVVLRLYLDWSVEATADALGVKAGTVKSRLSRALDRLEETLGGDET